MERTIWNKLRILVTNKCNYRCPFCHNEGQSKENERDIMSFEKFKILIDYLKEQEISELHFSGGEPFMNKDIIKMIEYVNNNTPWGIGCATNLSIISKGQIERIAKTRVKFNIQFPYVDETMFQKSTGNGKFQHILCQIKLVQSFGMKIGLNAVVQQNNMEHIRKLILFAIENDLTLKLLPQIGLTGSEQFKKQIYPILSEYEIKHQDKKTGAIRWTVQNQGMSTTVLYIDSPCFNKNIQECRAFGELRIHPDMSLQTCIIKDKLHKLNLELGKEHTLFVMKELWKDFKTC